ncbi:hypothetical protein [Pseudoalteromonas luteoviolacea]|uniref:hypothetical protein n=1 Tax=Pseudoalteromonas luteoviolacea TaxID=43657 RepID=UPI001150CB91|nr:hypothetical protein [Pseudoalteromonas luteoviolacea]TQF72689.1 hypothetical protein FLM44_17270 [Pseudoalteromonas luteoviolacea]
MVEINKLQLELNQCTDLVRVGEQHERGHLIPARAIAKTKTLLSLGANDNWAFDRAFQQLNPDCKVVGVDYQLSLSSIVSGAFSSGAKSLQSALLGQLKQSKQHVKALLNRVLLYTFYSSGNRLLRRRVSDHTNEVDISLETLIAVYGTIEDNATMLNISMSCDEYHMVDDIIRLESMLSVVTIELSPVPDCMSQVNQFIERMSESFEVVHISGGEIDEHNQAPLELTFMNRRLASPAK